MGQHCPTCTCGNCKPQKQTTWNKGDSLDKYPGDRRFHTNYSKVESDNKRQTYYIDQRRENPAPTPESFPTPQQKRQIIDICKKDKSNFEICGLILDDGRVIQLPNISHKDKRHTFLLDYRRYPNAVAIWHRHLAENGHSGDVSGGDIALAKEAGLSMLMVYDEGIDSMPYEKYTWGEFHPKGKPQVKYSSQLPQQNNHSLTPQQKQQIINICKRNKNREEIGGVITFRGEVIQLPNQAKNKRDHFQFKWNGLDAVAIWHEHLAENGHAKELSASDIAAADQSGLSMYACYSGDWSFAEYHPNGQPNQTPVRNYTVSFACPTAYQIMKKQKEAVEWIQEDNKKLQQAVAAATQEIQAKQRELLQIATRTLTTGGGR